MERKLFWMGCFLMLSALFLRSGVYLVRIVREFSRPNAQAHFPEITTCSPRRVDFTNEETFVWQYRNYGVVCKD